MLICSTFPVCLLETYDGTVTLILFPTNACSHKLEGSACRLKVFFTCLCYFLQETFIVHFHLVLSLFSIFEVRVALETCGLMFVAIDPHKCSFSPAASRGACWSYLLNKRLPSFLCFCFRFKNFRELLVLLQPLRLVKFFLLDLCLGDGFFDSSFASSRLLCLFDYSFATMTRLLRQLKFLGR